MGYGIYTKNYTDKFGKVSLFLKIDSSEGVYRKTIPGIKINPKHYDLSRYILKQAVRTNSS